MASFVPKANTQWSWLALDEAISYISCVKNVSV
jgi:hypothetical protein